MTFQIFPNLTSQSNQWSALQTFGNNISIGGKQFNVTSLATNQVISYNGTNWINANVFVSVATANTGIVTATQSNYINYTPPASAGTYLIMASVDSTTGTGSVAITIAYTNSRGIAISQTMAMVVANGTIAASVAMGSNLSGNCIPITINIDNSATAITLTATLSGGTGSFLCTGAVYKVV